MYQFNCDITYIHNSLMHLKFPMLDIKLIIDAFYSLLRNIIN